MHPSVRGRRPENRWSPEEDKILLSAIEQCGPIAVWNKVSACLPGRNSKSCRKRWIHSLDPNLRRWTEAEDALLTGAVKTYGTHWFRVAKMLPGRTDDQCAKRWRENLDPSISRKPWTEEDDKLLMKTYEKIGKRWKDIASRFQGRPPMHCRNRVQSLVRARRKASAAARKAAHSGLKGTEPVGEKTVIPVESMLAPSDFSGEEISYIEEEYAPSDTSGYLLPTPGTSTSESCQGIQQPQYSTLILTDSIQEVYCDFPIVSTLSQPYYHPALMHPSDYYLPHHDCHSQSISTSPLWGTPHPPLVRPDIYGEDSWGTPPSLPPSPPLSDLDPTVPRWVVPWSPPQCEQVGAQLLCSSIEMRISVPTTPYNSRGIPWHPQENTHPDTYGCFHHRSQVSELASELPYLPPNFQESPGIYDSLPYPPILLLS